VADLDQALESLDIHLLEVRLVVKEFLLKEQSTNFLELNVLQAVDKFLEALHKSALFELVEGLLGGFDFGRVGTQKVLKNSLHKC
jgi:hypothetical protein